MTPQTMGNPNVQKYTNQATDSGFKLLGKALAMATWGIVSFIREMFKMVMGK